LLSHPGKSRKENEEIIETLKVAHFNNWVLVKDCKP